MKNKLFLFTLILGFAFGLITFTSCGDDDEVPTPSAPCQDNENIIVDGIAYNTTKDGDATVIRKSSVDGYKGNVAIPEQINFEGATYSVTSIGEYAFSYCSNLTSITIPGSVTKIEAHAFHDCDALKAITIPNSVKSIGFGVVGWCERLETVVIGNGISHINDWAFEECPSLKSVKIPSSVTRIGYYVFRNCTSLKTITIPHSVTTIDSGSFENCTNLKSVTCLAWRVPSTLYGEIFKNVPLDAATLYVFSSAIEDYRAASEWSEFGTIQGI